MKKILLSLVVLLLSIQMGKAQFYSASTNILGWGTGSPNAEVSMTINREWSIHTGLSFNPWKIEDFRIQHFVVRPEIRYWISESYRGWYVGANAMYGIFHIGIPKAMQNKYEGIAAGGGLDVGYAWAIAPKWNLELGIGGSVLWMDTYKSLCRNCAMRTEEVSGVYVLPTKAALSVVYLF